MIEDRFESIRSFVAVAQRLSFVEAAETLRIDSSTLSRRIRRLEKTLGVRLFNRNTRHVVLTEAGAIYLVRCLDILARLDEADAAISSLSGDPRGVLHLTLPVAFGQRHITPALPEFLALYPRINLELFFTDRFVDVLEENIDVAVRIGKLRDSQLIARKLAPNRRVLCASLDYLNRYGRPEKPEDLEKHNCLIFSLLATGNTWHFSCGEKQVNVPVQGRIVSDNAEALYQAALSGCGIALLATFIVGKDLRCGRLLTVLDEWTTPQTDIFAVFAPGRYVPSKIRVFVDFLIERFRGVPYWEL
ncbi:LysR family transcriptional regulator [Scytonema sp. UIC 10036]|uniref:LysR family transcriptional regulator n=1 Tax=Scytonema sp. UIC 10036 TaxID=2304196 RepID=UPI0012DA8376|nr:LysR family transcriptional regulator [Scytonema sp. UIC 10036]MUG94580.1 LysR family transcriptional regulator [Scytonema sp. UIC 10036]